MIKIVIKIVIKHEFIEVYKLNIEIREKILKNGK